MKKNTEKESCNYTNRIKISLLVVLIIPLIIISIKKGGNAHDNAALPLSVIDTAPQEVFLEINGDSSQQLVTWSPTGRGQILCYNVYLVDTEGKRRLVARIMSEKNKEDNAKDISAPYAYGIKFGLREEAETVGITTTDSKGNESNITLATLISK